METSTRRAAGASELLDAVGPAFSRLRRAAALNVEKPLSRKDLTRTLVVSTVQENQGHEVTVGVVGERLSVDPSAASRMVSDCISAGYLVRTASQVDGRRIVLQLTDEGHKMLADFRRHQRSAFERITRDWPDEERLEFARLLIKYVDTLAELQPGPTATGLDSR
jgi:DNA-binding MarR family transcriptional regulator